MCASVSGKGFAGRVAGTRQAVRISDLEHAEIVNPLLREKGLKSLLGVPLIVEGRVIGVLHVGSLEEREFTDDDVDLLSSAGDRAALAIHGRLAERDRGLADALQQSLLPSCPRFWEWGSRAATCRRPRPSSAATGTTPSRSRAAGSAWRSATCPAGASTPPR